MQPRICQDSVCQGQSIDRTEPASLQATLAGAVSRGCKEQRSHGAVMKECR